ncbi:hypothetical protein BCR32DRAFT_246643 [Anaeromyces robustus]|uniref:Uncharacterized protein n=1 Tax=Anaeromyces robustus TaxID=1754192 RepID=A0A1Y1X0G4_9FUNG|nr:hypothetical protein BCR32DRAFT_246643 [Anaeromyces robustus]|eukprot:ORX79098.1 hypothetical protein BCR32DRAFT_246643 [Anaeromyces robustus]
MDYIEEGYINLKHSEFVELQSLKHRFIENRTASLWEWTRSKGTNFQCYLNYLDQFNPEGKIDNKISAIRTVLYTFNMPIKSNFFYWTLLIFILHKFNFKKPIMKLVTFHYLFRVIGDILFSITGLLEVYPINEAEHSDANDPSKITGYHCNYYGMDPFRFILTQQIGVMCGNIGEIFGDWYLLFRTKAVVKDKIAIRPVYITCAIYNLTKVAMVALHWSYSPTKLHSSVDGTYNQTEMDLFYFKFWLIQLIIIYASLIYDITVYWVLRKNVFKDFNMTTQFGFVRSFKNLSEFRIIICALIHIVFLSIVSFIIIIKFYFYYSKGYSNLNFAFDDIRNSIYGVQYYTIFIDQILLMRSSSESSAGSSEVLGTGTNNTTNGSRSLNFKFNNSNNNLYIDPNSKYQYKNLGSTPSIN